MPGPAPKRESERTRRGTPESGPARHGQLRPTSNHNADKTWHKRAVALFDSFKNSGQADFFQDSDWITLKIVCDLLTTYYERPKAMDMQNIWSMLTSLGVTEGARRQVLRVELERPEVPDTSVADAAIDLYQERLKRGRA